MDEQRELNVNILVAAADLVHVSIGVYIELKQGYSFSEVSAAVRSAVNAFINSLEVGEDILESHLGRVILDVEGVYDYFWMGNYINFYTLDSDQFAVLMEANIEELTE